MNFTKILEVAYTSCLVSQFLPYFAYVFLFLRLGAAPLQESQCLQSAAVQPRATVLDTFC